MICPTCGKIFCEKIPYERHITVHSEVRTEKCSKCPKRFKHYTDLNRHLAIHREDKPFTCDICSMSFTRKEYLRSHNLTHMEKSFKCHYCSQVFGRKDYVKSHIRRRHPGLPISKGNRFLIQFPWEKILIVKKYYRGRYYVRKRRIWKSSCNKSWINVLSLNFQIWRPLVSNKGN